VISAVNAAVVRDLQQARFYCPAVRIKKIHFLEQIHGHGLDNVFCFHGIMNDFDGNLPDQSLITIHNDGQTFVLTGLGVG
jgi:hypothetical protein